MPKKPGESGADGGDKRAVRGRMQIEARFLRKRRMECAGALAGAVAHDLNNILAPVVMAPSMLRLPLSPEDREKAISAIEESGQRGAAMIRRLLVFARGIEGEKEPIEPAGLLQEAVAIVEQTFPGNIDLEVRVSQGLWNVVGDRAQLHQVLLDLCVNARDAMADGGRLVLEAKNSVVDPEHLPPSPHARSGSFVVLAVSDTGRGIPAGDLHEIFDPIFSAKLARGEMGLGLLTTLAIVRSHFGFISVESREGEGSRFSVYLPSR